MKRIEYAGIAVILLVSMLAIASPFTQYGFSTGISAVTTLRTPAPKPTVSLSVTGGTTSTITSAGATSTVTTGGTTSIVTTAASTSTSQVTSQSLTTFLTGVTTPTTTLFTSTTTSATSTTLFPQQQQLVNGDFASDDYPPWQIQNYNGGYMVITSQGLGAAVHSLQIDAAPASVGDNGATRVIQYLNLESSTTVFMGVGFDNIAYPSACANQRIYFEADQYPVTLTTNIQFGFTTTGQAFLIFGNTFITTVNTYSLNQWVYPEIIIYNNTLVFLVNGQLIYSGTYTGPYDFYKAQLVGNCGSKTLFAEAYLQLDHPIVQQGLVIGEYLHDNTGNMQGGGFTVTVPTSNVGTCISYCALQFESILQDSTNQDMIEAVLLGTSNGDGYGWTVYFVAWFAGAVSTYSILPTYAVAGGDLVTMTIQRTGTAAFLVTVGDSTQNFVGKTISRDSKTYSAVGDWYPASIFYGMVTQAQSYFSGFHVSIYGLLVDHGLIYYTNTATSATFGATYTGIPSNCLNTPYWTETFTGNSGDQGFITFATNTIVVC